MAKITLNNVQTGVASRKTLQANFDLIEDEFDSKVLYRNNPSGVNQMENLLDMNSNKVINLPAPVDDNEPARWIDVKNGVTGISEPVPSQTGNANKFLSTTGSSLAWKKAQFTYSTLSALRAETISDFSDNDLFYVAHRSAVDDQGGGLFYWDSSDLSTEVTADEVTTNEGDGGIYVAPTSDKTGASGAWVRLDTRIVTPEMYGAAGDGVTDDTTPVTRTFNQGGPFKYFSQDYSVTAALSITLSDSYIYGKGKIINDGTGSIVLTLTGDDNSIESIGIESEVSQQSQTTLLYIVGDRNTVNQVRIGWQIFDNPNVDTEQYGSNGISLTGDHNTAFKNYIFNTNTAILDVGIGNNISMNNIYQCCVGVNLSNKSRHGSVIDNYIDCNDAGQTLQACDGIWGNRNHRFTTISGNTILNAGEHGMYLQGDNITVIGNVVRDSYGQGIKAGAKTSGNYWYPGETVRELAPNGDYTSYNIIIDNNICENNETGSGSGAEIYFQPNVMDSIISNNTCRFGGEYGIRTVFFSGGSINEVMKGITITGNKIHDNTSGSILAAASSDLIISNNDADDTIQTSSRDAAEPCINSKIAGNITDANIVISRQTDCLIQDNKAAYLGMSTDSARLYDNEFTSQQSGTFNNRIRDMRNNVFTFTGASVTESLQGCQRIEGNTFLIPDATNQYCLDVDVNSTTPFNGVFNDNVIYAPNSDRPVRVGGSNGSISGNAVTNDGTAEWALSCYSDYCIISGNVVPTTAYIRLESGSSNNVVNANAALISDAGTANGTGPNR